MKEPMPRYSYEIVFDSDRLPFTCGGYFSVGQVLGKIKEIISSTNLPIKEANIVYMDDEGNLIKTGYEEAIRARERLDDLGYKSFSFSI